MDDTRSRGRAAARTRWGVPIVAGLALGLFALATDAWPNAPRDVRIIGQLAGPWLLVAAAVGRRARSVRDAATDGLVALLVGVATYDAPLLLMGTTPLFAVLWLVVAFIVGPIGGVLGHVSGERTMRGVTAFVVLWGTAIGELAARVDPLNNHLAWVVALLLGVAVATAPARRLWVGVGVCLVGAGSAVLFPLLLAGIAGW